MNEGVVILGGPYVVGLKIISGPAGCFAVGRAQHDTEVPIPLAAGGWYTIEELVERLQALGSDINFDERPEPFVFPATTSYLFTSRGVYPGMGVDYRRAETDGNLYFVTSSDFR